MNLKSSILLHIIFYSNVIVHHFRWNEMITLVINLYCAWWILLSLVCTGADSLHYLTVEGLQQAVVEGIKGDGLENTGHCVACLTGNYPTDLDWWGVDPTVCGGGLRTKYSFFFFCGCDLKKIKCWWNGVPISEQLSQNICYENT